MDTPPSTKFKCKADVERYASWVGAMGARTRLTAAQINALLKFVSTWNKLQERAEKEIVEAWVALNEKCREQLRLLVKAREAYEDDHPDRGEALVEEVAELRQEIKEELLRIGAKQGEQEDRYNGH